MRLRQALPGTQLARLLIVTICLALAYAQSFSTTDEKHRKLVDYIIQHGGEVNLMIAEECPGCMRGTIATKDFNENDTVLRIPLSSAVLLTKRFHRPPYTMELARALILEMHNNPNFNKTHGVYWDTMPLENETFTGEMFTEKHIEMVEQPFFRNRTKAVQKAMEEIYDGTFPSLPLDVAQEQFDKQLVPLHVFKYVASLISSRSYSLNEIRDGDAFTPSTLLPIADLINHSNFDFNVQPLEDATHIAYKALRPIKKGEVVRASYKKYTYHRSDFSLFDYGFINYDYRNRENIDPPILCAWDLPDAKTHRTTIFTTPRDDAIYYGPTGLYNTRAEYNRLRDILSECKTTLEDDIAMLENGAYEDWKEELIIKFRIERKTAIKGAMEAIKREMMNPNTRKTEL